MIAFIGAMEEEVKALTRRMKNRKTRTVSGQKFWLGTLAGKPCVACQSGIGKTAAAITTAVLMENFHVSGVVNIGIAGGLDEKEKILDLVVSKRIAHHDVDVSAFNWPVGFDQHKTCFWADPHYCQTMAKIVREEGGRVWLGDMVSGDQFIWKKQQVKQILQNYPTALCADMEGASIAQTCVHYHKPFIVIRSLSDITVKRNSEKDSELNTKDAAEQSAVWCEKFIARI